MATSKKTDTAAAAGRRRGTSRLVAGKGTIKVEVVRYGSCEIFASIPMRCFICGLTIPAYTHHKCERRHP